MFMLITSFGDVYTFQTKKEALNEAFDGDTVIKYDENTPKLACSNCDTDSVVWKWNKWQCESCNGRPENIVYGYNTVISGNQLIPPLKNAIKHGLLKNEVISEAEQYLDTHCYKYDFESPAEFYLEFSSSSKIFIDYFKSMLDDKVYDCILTVYRNKVEFVAIDSDDNVRVIVNNTNGLIEYLDELDENLFINNLNFKVIKSHIDDTQLDVTGVA